MTGTLARGQRSRPRLSRRSGAVREFVAQILVDAVDGRLEDRLFGGETSSRFGHRRNVTDFLLLHGYALLFGAALAAQLGVPVPGAPVLLAAGALAKSGHMGLAQVLALSVLASLLGHALWFEAGRRRGGAVLRLLCRISIEPDSCVRRTEDVFARHGGRALVAAPWVPGLATIAPPLAGMSGMRWRRFLLLDGLGAFVWAVVFAGLGFAFGPQLTEAAQVALRYGSWFGLAVGVVLGAWIAWKIAQRHWLLRNLSVPRAEPDELLARLAAADAPLVVDLRSEVTVAAEPVSLPGALLVEFDDLAAWAEGVPRDREIILTCD